MVRTHLAIAQGAQEAMEVNIQVFSTDYVPAFLERGGRCELQQTFNTENKKAWLMLLKTVKFELASFR